MDQDEQIRQMAVACANAETGEVAVWLDLPSVLSLEGKTVPLPTAIMSRHDALWLARQLIAAACLPDDLRDTE